VRANCGQTGALRLVDNRDEGPGIVHKLNRKTGANAGPITPNSSTIRAAPQTIRAEIFYCFQS